MSNLQPKLLLSSCCNITMVNYSSTCLATTVYDLFHLSRSFPLSKQTPISIDTGSLRFPMTSIIFALSISIRVQKSSICLIYTTQAFLLQKQSSNEFCIKRADSTAVLHLRSKISYKTAK